VKRATEQKQRQKAVGQHGGVGEGAARDDRRRRSEPQSRSSEAIDGARADGVTVDARSRVEQVSCLLFSLSNRSNGRDERGYCNKKIGGCRCLLGWYVGPRRGVGTDGCPARIIYDKVNLKYLQKII
jgi:hypothetical protein